MSTRKRITVSVAMLLLAFVAGFVLARGLDRAASSTAQRQADQYRQILADLERHYYRQVDVTRLGRTGITSLLASLHDPYTVYFTRRRARLFGQELSGSYSGIGVAVAKKAGGLEVTTVFPGSPAAAAGMKPGDVIVSVDGTATAGLSTNAVVGRIAGPAGTTVHLQVRPSAKPGSELTDLTLTRRSISLPLTTSRLLNDHGTKVGYVALSTFAKGAGAAVHKAVVALQRRGARWIVFDLRNNGGGLVDEAASVTGDFLPPGRTVVTTQGAHAPKDVLKTSGHDATSLPLVVLVNGNTASASEIVTGALQDYRRGTIIGTRTFGKGVVQETFPLSGGAELKVTVASYRTPLGRDINHKGIEPAIVVSAGAHPSSAGFGTRRDRVLSRALAFISSGR